MDKLVRTCSQSVYRQSTGLGTQGKAPQQGATMVEYALVTFLVTGALFMPLPELGMSVVDWVLQAIKGYQANSTYLLSLP